MRITRPEWEEARAVYLERVRPWTTDRILRMNRGEKHPVYDFLFEYYSFRPARLLRWTPGFGVRLDDARRDELAWSEFLTGECATWLPASAFPKHRLPYLQWGITYLETTLNRYPSFNCMGLHEWAMVYRDPTVRHPRVPFRLTRAQTDEFVESQSLRCSHFDAFRFFTPSAAPRNRWALTRADTTEHDQPGCIHVTMDLYRFAYKIAPFCPSEVVADAFDVARAAREVDMRASPYDLRAFGFLPVQIETPEGRTEYAELQRSLYQRGQPVRERLLTTYRKLLEQCSSGK